MIPSINLTHKNSDGNGYGRLGQQLEYALNRLGIASRPLNMLDTGEVPGVCMFVQLPGHATGWFDGQRSIVYTMFETTQIPAEFMEVLHEYDTLIVPCEANAQSFRPHHPNVHVVPLGVDPERWHYTPRRLPRKHEPFVFLTVGAGWKRKGFDIATECFLRLRDELHQPMQLIVKMQSEPIPDELPRDPDIIYLRENVSPDEEVQLFQDAHCYLGPSKGEGWGLCPHQAIAQGLPTVLTDAAGQHEYARWGFPVEWHFEDANYGIWEDTGQWWVPNTEDFYNTMRYVYQNYDIAVDRAKFGAEGIAHLTWDHTASLVAPLLGESLPFQQHGWYTCDRKVFPIQVSERWEGDVGGQKYEMVPGETYYEFADVKRIVYNAGKLDPRCPVEGLNRTQVEDRSARVFACPTCHRPYQTAEELATEVLSELEAAT